jgi:hypothetical protein
MSTEQHGVTIKKDGNREARQRKKKILTTPLTKIILN